MQAFEFRTVPHLICHAGATRELGASLRTHFPQVQHVLIVTDPGFLKTGQVDAILHKLQESGIRYSLFSDVQADPPEALIQQAVDFARQQQIQLVVGLGGGSSMDVAKLVAVLYPDTQALQDMYGIGKVEGQRLPLVQIPTTAGTGSEVTPISIVTTGATTKMGVVAPQLFADLAILDAELTVGLPAAISAATGIDAMVHAIEAYTTRHKKNPLSDMLALQALNLLWSNIRTVCREPQNLQARQAMLLGALLAGQSFANAPCAAVHALAYPIGGIFHVPHGLSNSLILPAVLRFNAPSSQHLYAQLAGIIAPQAQGDAASKTAALIHALEVLPAELGIPSRLREVGISENDLDRLAQDAMLQTRLLSNNPREVSWQDARNLYAEML
jgi:alcohol dehydrogenase class IV